MTDRREYRGKPSKMFLTGEYSCKDGGGPMIQNLSPIKNELILEASREFNELKLTITRGEWE